MGCSDEQKRRLGNWADGGSMTNNYESVIPRKAIHNLAGFLEHESYYLPRTSIPVPDELLEMVFPSINELLNG